MNIEHLRAKLEILEIESTNLTDRQMVGFHAGWKLAHESEVDQLVQGIIDCLSSLLESDNDRLDFAIGKLVGWAYYWQSLLEAIK